MISWYVVFWVFDFVDFKYTTSAVRAAGQAHRLRPTTLSMREDSNQTQRFGKVVSLNVISIRPVNDFAQVFSGLLGHSLSRQHL